LSAEFASSAFPETATAERKTNPTVGISSCMIVAFPLMINRQVDGPAARQVRPVRAYRLLAYPCQLKNSRIAE
jgi:hypothetical protein